MTDKKMDAEAYWSAFDPDKPISDVDGALRWAAKIQAKTTTAVGLAYRGQCQHAWGPRSSLHRAFASPPDEKQLQQAEQETMKELREWQLNLHATGMLPALPLLAALQHLGGKTRLIDVTHSVAIGLWFAVNSAECDGVHGRLFAMTYTEDLASSPEGSAREWSPDPFWWTEPGLGDELVIWTPPPIERRMTRQHGAFLVGAVSTGNESNIRQLPDRDRVDIEDWQEIVSIKKRAYRLSAKGRPPAQTQVLYTARVLGGSKETIRKELDDRLDISSRTMYPDLPGYVEYSRGLPVPRRV